MIPVKQYKGYDFGRNNLKSLTEQNYLGIVLIQFSTHIEALMKFHQMKYLKIAPEEFM